MKYGRTLRLHSSQSHEIFYLCIRVPRRNGGTHCGRTGATQVTQYSSSTVSRVSLDNQSHLFVVDAIICA